MPEQATTISDRRDTNPCNRLHGLLEELRAQLALVGQDVEVDRLLVEVSDTAERIVAEHRGMADELLGVYDQLGIVFEVARKLPTVSTEAEVLDLFLDSLRRCLEGRTVIGVRPLDEGGWMRQGRDLGASERIESLMDRSRDSRMVLVEPVAAEDAQDDIMEVMVGPVFAGDVFVCAIVVARPRSVPAFRASDMLFVESLAMFCGDLIRIQRLAGELHDMSVTMVRSLVSAVDQKDEYTSGHSVRVGYYATFLGRKLELAPTDLQMLQWGALLHDVGKIGIRDDVLKKKGKLTDEEFRHMKEHPERSYKVVEGVAQLSQALDGVLYHHEHYDGTGYPAGLSGESIPLHARVIQIADIFDALTSSRSYRSAFDWRKALTILEEESGRVVDPRLQKMFDGLIRAELDGEEDAWEQLVLRAEQIALKFGDNDSVV